MKFSIINFGCKLNIFESEAMINQLVNHGFQLINDYNESDIVIINSCTVTSKADSKINYMIRKIKKTNPKIIVALAGCVVDTDKENLIDNNLIDLLITNKDKDKIASAIDELKTNKISRKLFISDLDGSFNYEIYDMFKHSRAFIKIQDGCNNYCSYCKIPYARGQSRSDSLDKIVKQIINIEKNNFNEVILTGINIGNYNYNSHDFADLLLEILKNTKNIRMRLSSLEPIYFNDKLLEVIKNKRICPHFHIALQSGSDRILKLMNRKYDISYYLSVIEKIKHNFINPYISTDLIVGFPSESEEDFQQTIELLKLVKFSYIHVFPYSRRKGTKAENIKPFIQDSIIKKRVEIINELNKDFFLEYLRNNINKKFELLIEKSIQLNDNTFQYSGTTENYLEVVVETEKKLQTKNIYNIETFKIENNLLYGKLI